MKKRKTIVLMSLKIQHNTISWNMQASSMSFIRLFTTRWPHSHSWLFFRWVFQHRLKLSAGKWFGFLLRVCCIAAKTQSMASWTVAMSRCQRLVYYNSMKFFLKKQFHVIFLWMKWTLFECFNSKNEFSIDFHILKYFRLYQRRSMLFKSIRWRKIQFNHIWKSQYCENKARNLC